MSPRRWSGRLRAGMMPPPGARRTGSDSLLTLVETLEHRPRRGRRAGPQPRRPSVPAPESRGVRAGHSRVAGPRSGCRRLAAARPDEQQLRQHRRGPDALGDAARELPERGQRDQPPRHRPARRKGRWITPTPTPSTSRSIPGDHVEGAPYGTRGGLVVDHVFPADAEYTFGVTFTSGANTRIEDVDVFDRWGAGFAPGLRPQSPGRSRRARKRRYADPADLRPGRNQKDCCRLHPAAARALRGPDPPPTTGPTPGAVRAARESRPCRTSATSSSPAPYNATGLSETPSRRKIFTCRPTAPEEARPCASRIVARLGREAYRRASRRRRSRGPARILRRGQRQRRVRDRHAERARGDACEPPTSSCAWNGRRLRPPTRRPGDTG